MENIFFEGFKYHVGAVAVYYNGFFREKMKKNSRQFVISGRWMVRFRVLGYRCQPVFGRKKKPN